MGKRLGGQEMRHLASASNDDPFDGLADGGLPCEQGLGARRPHRRGQCIGGGQVPDEP
jgi:hypothetical protein